MISDSRSGPMDRAEPSDSLPQQDAFDESKNSVGDVVEREAKLQEIVNMLFDGILIIQDGLIIETNHGLLSMTGHEGWELVGRKIEELDGWKDLGKSLVAVSDEPVSFESLLPRKSSHPVHATVRARRVSVGNSGTVMAVIAGMTEDEPASASLLRSAERYRSLFQAIPDLVFTKDQKP